ncbi:hypothetical protein [Chromobacterium haemolyticum]|uniref:Uncharacterized protein n=1 Tax=Chromobacterium haemolyticum TaxID=394935 RepID=A0A1W0CCW9_9NEIS|nr:hypothetical protein [Chromobacterium haemolyticum]OQS32589.1 hypothetical protein B0T45_21545 [Chromobacterium haemolyticum]
MASALARLQASVQRLGRREVFGELVLIDCQEVPATVYLFEENSLTMDGMVLADGCRGWLIVQDENMPAGSRLAGKPVSARGGKYEIKGKPQRTPMGDWRLDLREVKP